MRLKSTLWATLWALGPCKGPLWPYNTPLKVAILLGRRGWDLGSVTTLRGLQRGVRGASPGKILKFNPLNYAFNGTFSMNFQKNEVNS